MIIVFSSCQESDKNYKIAVSQCGSGRWRDKVNSEMLAAQHLKILGIDGMPGEGIQYVLQGSLSGTYVYPTHGEEVVKLALQILTG